MAAPIRFLSGRNQQQKIGIEGSTDNQKVLEVVGRVGIGTTIFEPTSELEVRGDIIVSGIVTAGSIEVSSGEVNFDDVNVSGASTFTGAIDANGSLDVDGHTELDDLNVSGVSTFTGAIDANGGLDVTGHTELDNVNVGGASTTGGLLDINAGAQANTLKVEDLTDNRVVIAGTGGELEDDDNLTFNGTQLAIGVDLDVDGHTELDDLNVSGVSTFTGAIDANGSIDVDGHTELDDVNVSGVSTFAGAADFNGSIDVDGHTELDDVNVSGVSTFVGLGTFKNDLYVSDNVYIAGFVTATRLYSSVFGEFTGSSVSADNLVGSALSVSGLSTFTGAADFNGSIDVDGHTELDDVNVSGATTTGGLLDINAGAQANTLKVEDLTDNRVVIVGTGGELEDDANLTFNGTQLAIGVNLDVDGHTELDNVNVSGAITATTFTGNLTGTINTAAQTDITSLGTLSSLTVSGDITANGNIAGDNSTNITGIAGVTATTLSGTLQTAVQTNITSVGTLSALTVSGDITVQDDDSGSAAGPEFKLYRNSSSPADADYLGQIKFAGESDTGVERNYAKITGKIGDASNGTEDGILEFAHIKSGSQVITGRWNSTTLQLLNDTALSVAGDITANGNIAGDGSTNITGIAGVTASTLTGTLQTAAQTNITSVGTLSALTVSGDITANGNIAGDNSTNITGIAGITATTLSGTLQTAAQTNITSVGTLTGLDVNGHSELDDVNVSGIITTASLNATGKLTTTGIGISIANGAGNTAYIEGPSEIWIDPHPFGVGQTSGSVRIRGDLYVDGTEFIVDVDKIELGDFNIGIASTVSTNSLLDGAGLGIGAISIRKTITWNNATSALMSSENWNLASGKHYEINGTDVLTSDTLGSGVVNSSLTSVGTLGALTVSGNVNANGNITGDNATNISGINSVTATSFYGSGVNLTALNASNLGSGTVPDARFPATLPAIDGSNLTGLTASQIGALRGLTINEEGSLVGTANSVSSINFVSSNLTATASGVGATITLTNTPTFSSLNVTGTTTIPNISGVTTFANDVIVGTGITFYASTGIISATAFYGDGQNLNNLINQRIEGLQIFDEGVAVGTGYTFAALDVVGNNVSVSAVGLGTTARITVSDTPTFDTVTVTNNITANGNIVGDNSTNITGINQVTATTFSGALSGAATQVTVADESSDTTCFPLFVTAATGDVAPKSGTNLTFNSADGTLTATDFNTTSDENLKDNIRTIEDPLAKVVEIRGVNFDWKETQKPSVGVIAQEVEKVFPELVANGEKKTVNYNGLIGLLIEVVKEQQTQINSLNERLSQLE